MFITIKCTTKSENEAEGLFFHRTSKYGSFITQKTCACPNILP